MNTAHRIEPSQHLYQGAVYTHSTQTDLRTKWAVWFAENARPISADEYQRNEIAANNTMRNPDDRS